MRGSDEIGPGDFPQYPPMDPTGTVDLAQLERSLDLTPAQRLQRLDEWMQFIRHAHRSFRERHGIDPAEAIRNILRDRQPPGQHPTTE